MSSGDSVEAPAQPREWFAVLFGTRCLRGEKAYINCFMDALKGICLEEGVLLTSQPHRNFIFVDENVDELVSDIGDTIKRIQERHTEGLHMPLVLVIDDQTLLQLHDDYIDPAFSNDAFIYSLRAVKVKEFVSVDSWNQVRADIKEMKHILDEYNTLPPLPASLRARPQEERPRSRDTHQEGRQDERRQHRSPHDDFHDELRARREPTRPITVHKAEMTPDVVLSALAMVRDNPDLKNALAEDMDANIDFMSIPGLPWPPHDMHDLLTLYVMAAEQMPAKDKGSGGGTEREAAGVRLRKKIAETMLKSRLLKHVLIVFVADLHELVSIGDLNDVEMRTSASAINLLLRAFVQLGKHHIFDDDALSLWGELEAPVFTLPGRFWRAVDDDVIEKMCTTAAEVTSNDPNVYRNSVLAALQNEPAPHVARSEERRPNSAASSRSRPDEPEKEQTRRRANHGAQHAAGPSSSKLAYRYDPYGVDDDDEDDDGDESDTSEVYCRGGEDGYDARLQTATNGYGNNGGRNKEQEEEEKEDAQARQRRWEEERREREEEAQQRAEQEAEAARRYERTQHELALMRLERKKKWEESNEMCIAWAENDGVEPAISYRTLANRPVYSDLYQPKAPFMRKALLNGAYTDNEHYLDVQFRLMREDMVAPLRDGIYNQKILTDPSKLIASTHELRIYATIQLGALQVRGVDGLPMRIVTIPSSMLATIREEKQLKFGQCVVLSSDKFTREFHIGWICDRFQDPGLPWQGRLAISLFDECLFNNNEIDKTLTYAIAESPSYLEAYRHVLRVIKKMKKHVIFPLERYLVHMKKNTRLPQYMRAKEKDEDKEEDKQRQIMYSKKMVEEGRKKEAEKKEAEKKKQGRTTPASSGEADQDYVTTEEGVSEENLVDDGFNTDEEDTFLTGGMIRGMHPNPKDLDTISISGKSYNVATLAEDYESDELDDTQRKALCYALTSELAIIQGPPGTGKTHLGVEIVMAILENRIKWRLTEPILIVTFSNQALDHFLDKVRQKIEDRGLGSEDAPSVVRLGSRSEHEAIKLNCLLGTVMKDYEEDLAGECSNERIKTRKHKQAYLSKLMRAVKTVQLSRRSIMQYNLLRQVMNPTHEMQLRQAEYLLRDSSGNKLNMDEVLVSWLLNKTYEKRRDMPPGSDDDDIEPEWGGGGMAYRSPAPKPVVEPRKTNKQGGGRETKKEKNERKRAERRHADRNTGSRRIYGGGTDSDDEDDGPTMDNLVDDGAGEEGADYEMDADEEKKATEALLAALDKMNRRVASQQQAAANNRRWNDDAEKYEMDEDWECEREHAAKHNGRMLVDDVEIFSRTTKSTGVRTGRGETKQVAVDANIVRDCCEQKEYILSKEALIREEADAIMDVRTIPKERRWRLLVYWQNKLASEERASLDDLCRRHAHACQVAEDAADVARAAVLRRALIIGATTTGSAKRRALMARIAPKVLVVEEAAEVLEAHLLASIVPSVQHAIFIGDHQQLRPSTAVHVLAKMANMEVSLFERLVKNGYPFQTLGLQHRMLAPLTKYVVKPFFYQKLQDAPSIHEYPSVAGMHTNLFFWAHSIAENHVSESMSKKNVVEAEMCRNLANYIVMQGQYRPQEITIIGMYGAQVTEIKEQLRKIGGQMTDVAVETVDSFQGKENRIMILSLVRSNSGGVGFLATANRITVGLTRAQHGMYVVGNFADIANYSDLWRNIVDNLNRDDVNLIDYTLPVECQRHGHKTGIRVNTDFIRNTPYGGCADRCGFEMACGHACKQVCHPPYQHERLCSEGPVLDCKEDCTKRCPKCDARCSKKCKDACGTCHAIVTITLDCGHTVRCECGARNLARCKEPCAEELECGHMCQNKCSVECVPVNKCDQGVMYVHPICKHILTLPCHQTRNAIGTHQCYEPCPEKLVCGHKCPLLCGQPCPTFCETLVQLTGACGHRLQKKCSEDSRHVKCTALVDSAMPHCRHLIKMECYQSKNQSECRAKCGKPTSCGHECTLSCGECYKRASVHECGASCRRELPCGHRCLGTCGKPCVCDASCRVRCSHQRCGPMSKDKGGTLTYGRNCAQPCVLCIESCDNRCEHRSCSKKCFEVCDVSACSEPCIKQLRCGHACLGLCGEVCPDLCGTCKTTTYKTCVAQYPVDDEQSAQVTRLIQMPYCDHIFPYKYMDKKVKEQLAAGAIVLKCPRCSAMIEDCKRYLKQSKRLWTEADTRKWEQRMHDEDLPLAEVKKRYSEFRARLARQNEIAELLYKTIENKVGGGKDRFTLETFRHLDSLYRDIRSQLLQTASVPSDYHYWQMVISCFTSVAGLVGQYLNNWDLRIDVIQDRTANLRSVIDEAFDRRRSRVFPMRDAFKAMVDTIRASMEHRRVGVLVPLFRAAAIKAHLHFHMEHLASSMRIQRDENGGHFDLNFTQASTYKRVIKSILRDPPHDHPTRKLEDMMAKIHADVYSKMVTKPIAPPAKVFEVDLPQF